LDGKVGYKIGLTKTGLRRVGKHRWDQLSEKKRGALTGRKRFIGTTGSLKLFQLVSEETGS